jgi:hypothetical protein
MVDGELGQLLTELIPALGEAVQEQHQRSLTGVDVVKADVVDVGVFVLEVAHERNDADTPAACLAENRRGPVPVRKPPVRGA